MKLHKLTALLLGAAMMAALMMGCGTEKLPAETAASTEITSVSAETEAAEEKKFNLDNEDMDGNAIDNTVYEANELTLVNVWATWCGPCVKEIPDLQKLHEEDNGFGVVGILYDAYDSKSNRISQEAMGLAREILEKTGAQYPMVIPNSDLIENNFQGAASLFPMSFLVDSQGTIVKGPLGGAHSYEEWLQILNEAAGK